MKFGLSVLTLVIVSLLHADSFSHPHVFIDNSLKIVFNEKGLANINLKWVFDEMFSGMIIYEFDKNKNGKFEASEIEEIRKGAFGHLKNFDYFTHIKINGQQFKVRYVQGFSASICKNKVVYYFSIPCHVTAISTFKEVSISIYDKENYCSISLIQNNPVEFENTSSLDFYYQITKNAEEPYYFGMLFPEEIILKFRGKNG